MLMMAGLLAVSGFAAAAPAEPAAGQDPELASQRYHYQKAKSALAAGNLPTYNQHLANLGDYPLKPYLESNRLRENLSALPFRQIDAFLKEYQDSLLADRLRERTLHILARRAMWSEFNRYYDEGIASTELKCHSLNARLKTGDKSALNETAELWNVAKSQPSACDPIFQAWQEAGLMTQDLVWSRLYKAVEADQTDLARYLVTQLSELQPHGELLLRVHRYPTLIMQRAVFQNHDLPTQHMIAQGIKRLARKQPLDALYHWELYEAQQLFPEDLGLDTKHHVLRRLIRDGHGRQAQHLLSYSHALRKDDLVEEILREALTELDWSRVNETILLLEEESQQSERWLYWRARAQDELGKPLAGFRSSKQVYQELASNRSFYGFMAADKLGKAYALVDDSETVDAEVLAEIASLPGMRRALELWSLGNLHEARAEWLHTSRQIQPQQLLAAGQLARDWGWYNSGINAMISGNWWNHLTVRFPLAYRDEIDRVATNTRVDARLIYAVARQESAFDTRARSPVGAMGLMQIMPTTAQFTAKTFGVKHKNKEELYDVNHNIMLGGHYLQYLLGRFDGNRILAAAAYNAGPHRVSRWLSDEGQKRPYDVWIETIPFRETRHYVQNVLCYSVIYGYRMGQPGAFVSPHEAISKL